MQAYIAILRGINVSGKNMIKMAELKSCFTDNGFANVGTYIQSGNIVFSSIKKDEKNISAEIEAMILKNFGLTVPVIVRSIKDWKEAINGNPFMKRDDIDITKLHITFLANEPETERVANIKDLKFSPDEFIVAGNTVYLYCPDGYGNTKINNTFFENKLKVTATTRNWKTTLELMRIADGIA